MRLFRNFFCLLVFFLPFATINALREVISMRSGAGIFVFQYDFLRIAATAGDWLHTHQTEAKAVSLTQTVNLTQKFLWKCMICSLCYSKSLWKDIQSQFIFYEILFLAHVEPYYTSVMRGDPAAKTSWGIVQPFTPLEFHNKLNQMNAWGG